MRLNYIIYPVFSLILLMFRTGWTQACCSAGTPLLSSLEVASTAEKTWQLGLTYEYNFLDDVISGTDEIQGIRQRISQSLLAEISYGINDRFSLTALLSFNRQTRKLRNQNSSGSLEELSTRGLGDAVFLMTYNIITSSIVSQRQLSMGTGVKAPTGRSQLKSDGFLLPADLQPGTGAWDGILWLYYYQGFLPVTSAGLFTTVSYRLTGNSDRFDQSETPFREYEFGNELIISSGISYRTGTLFDLSLILRYRHTDPDRNEFADIANTGGNWFYLVPGLNVNFNDFSLRFSGQIPVYRDLKGIQLTTTNTISTALYYRFKQE